MLLLCGVREYSIDSQCYAEDESVRKGRAMPVRDQAARDAPTMSLKGTSSDAMRGYASGMDSHKSSHQSSYASEL